MTTENPTLSDAPSGRGVGGAWEQTAKKNVRKWGVQHPEELLSAIGEELGELEQAYLEATHEGEPKHRVEDEIDDLGPLLLQLTQSIRSHPLAFEPLPKASEVNNER